MSAINLCPVLTVFAWLSLLFPGVARTVVHSTPIPRIPASAFPAHVKIVYAPSVSNDVMDRTWGTDGYGQPFMHDTHESDLQRISGWMESGSRHHGQSYVYFAIYVSTYGNMLGHAGNVAAFYDWQASVAALWRLPLARTQPKALIPDGMPGLAETRVLPANQDGPTVTIAGWWGTTYEVEALAIFTPDVMSLPHAKRMLANIVRFAVRLPNSQTD